MKINVKALQLIEKGLSSKTVSKLTESQIDVLHNKLVSEQPQPQVVTKTVKQINLPSGSQTTVGGVSVSNQAGKVTVTPTNETELDEEDEVTIDPNKDTETQDPHQVGPSSDDGFGDETDDGMGMFEGKKKDGPNPWAICHAQVGPKKTRKFERCVMAVKKQLKEGKNPVSLFLENQITKIVEKHIPPRITKGDLMKYISEASPAPTTKPAPTKPDVKPTTKPRPAHPGKNPNPGENPAPKAKKKEAKENSPAPTTKPAPTKPTTKPGTRPKPAHPGKNPNPGENPAPKAKKVSAEDAKEKVIDTIMNLLQK
jgi:hypothetical protein